MSVRKAALVACAFFVLACAAGYGGLFSHAYPGDTVTYSKYGRALVNHGLIPYHNFTDEYPRVGAGHGRAGGDLGRALRARLQAADDRVRRRLRRLRGVDRRPARSLLRAARARRARARADGPGVPQPLRPCAGAPDLARPRSPPSLHARAHGGRPARCRHGDEGLRVRDAVARGTPDEASPRRCRRLHRRRRDSLPAFLPDRAGWRRLQLLDADEASPPDRDGRRLAPARGLEARDLPRRLQCRRLARLDRPQRHGGQRGRVAHLRARVHARRARRTPLLARSRHRRPARHRVRGCDRRLDRVREGAVAAVHDLARAARAARGRAQGPLRRGNLLRRARNHAAGVLPRQPWAARPELERVAAARAQRACSW